MARGLSQELAHLTRGHSFIPLVSVEGLLCARLCAWWNWEGRHWGCWQAWKPVRAVQWGGWGQQCWVLIYTLASQEKCNQ